MFLDIARHKLYEALITLVAVAVTIVVATVAMPVSALEMGGAPIAQMLHGWQLTHPIVAAIVGFAVVTRLAFMATRTAVRTHLYGANSFATMTLTPLVVMAMADRGSMLATILLAWLVVEALRRLFYAFGSEERNHAIFTAMLAIGAMPLLDSALLVGVVALPLILVSLRVSAREAVIAIVGALLPIFTYAYVSWCSGESFVGVVAEVCEATLTPSGVDMATYMTMPRLVVGATLLVLTLGSVALYMRSRLSLTLVARHAWHFVIAALVMLVAMVALLPSAMPATLVSLGVVVAAIAPMVLLRLSTLISVAIYILLVCGSIASLMGN